MGGGSPTTALKVRCAVPEAAVVNATENPTNALVVAHMALVGYHVNAMLGRVPAYVSRADLVSAGHLALVRAARAYDESTGVPFARYAALRIKGALVDELRGMAWVPRGARRRARQLNEVTDQLTGTLGRAPSRDELAAAMGMPVEEIDAAKSDAETRVLSMDGFDGSIAESVVATTMGPEESLLAGEKLQYLRAGIAALPERLRYVVTELFFHDRPVAELAEELGVTQSRISQLRTEALGLLKDGINASLDPDLVSTAPRPEGVAERRRQAYFANVAARAASSSQASTVAFVPTQRSAAEIELDTFERSAVG